MASKIRESYQERSRALIQAKQDPVAKQAKQSDLDLLEWAAAAADIDLFYLDESGFSLWTPVTYRYYFKGQ